MAGAVRCPLDTDLLHQGCPVTVKVVAVLERFSVFCMEKIFTFRAGVVPVPVEREQLVGNGHFPDTVFCFAVDHIKILLIQVYIYFFQGQEFGNPGAVIEQHEDNLVILIILHGPDPVDLFPGKFVPAVFVRVPVFVLRDIHVGGIIFVADIILQGKSVQLVKQDLYFLQCRIIFCRRYRSPAEDPPVSGL